MYIQVGIQRILEEAPAASPYHLTGKTFYHPEGLLACAARKGLQIPLTDTVCFLVGDSNHGRSRLSDGEDNYSYD